MKIVMYIRYCHKEMSTIGGLEGVDSVARTQVGSKIIKMFCSNGISEYLKLSHAIRTL